MVTADTAVMARLVGAGRRWLAAGGVGRHRSCGAVLVYGDQGRTCAEPFRNDDVNDALSSALGVRYH